MFLSLVHESSRSFSSMLYLSSAVSISDSSCSFTLFSGILTVLIFIGGAGPVLGDVPLVRKLAWIAA